MLKFLSASTSIVISKRAITECLENALGGEPDLDCDLIIIYTGNKSHSYCGICQGITCRLPGTQFIWALYFRI